MSEEKSPVQMPETPEKKSLMQRLRDERNASRCKHDVLGVEIWTSKLSLAENQLLRDRAPEMGADYMIEMLLLKCTLADGTPAFTRDDKPDLLANVSGSLLSPLIAAINGRSVPEQAKN